ncbi:MAG: outer membrane lipid asymmetry maintenance protein MlaD [Granulosicoccaceae bacterium]
MNSRTTEVLVGLFMLLFLAAMTILALKVSNLTSLSGAAGYQVHANFDNVGGLRVRAPVSAGGVKVGQVSQIVYDSDTFEAKVTLTIDEEFNLFPTDTSASIYTAGLLGEQYIGLEPGADDEVLEQDSEIDLTQSALVLERLIGQVLLNK